MRIARLSAALLAPYAGWIAPPQVAAQIPPAAAGAPTSVESLDCASRAVDISRIGPDLLTPGKADMSGMMKSVTPDMMKSFARSITIDPNGLCRYADANGKLGAATPNRVVFMGDSITENWGRAAPDLFHGEVIDRGISGQTTGQMLARFRLDVLDLHPRVVHIMAGINDINSPAGTVLTRSNIMSMVDLARARGIHVILGAITPSTHFWNAPNLNPASQILALNNWLKSYASKEHLRLIDYHAPLANAEGGIRDELANEGLHPNRNGYAIMTPLARAALAIELNRPARSD